MKIRLVFFLFFVSIIGSAQTDEHVLLNLGLDSVFSQVKENEPGGSIYIQQDNQIIYSRSFGLANLKTKEKFTENTNSNIAAITKTFIAYSILILQKQGKLSVEDSISIYFPEIKNKPVGRIKLRHLLTHTSGLPDVITNEKDLFKNIDKPEFDPGSNYKYSEIAYTILKTIIEKVSQDQWDVFIKKNIFAPTGMINTKTDVNYLSEKETTSYKKVKKKYKKYKVKKGELKNAETSVIWSSVGELKKYVYAIKECVFLECELLKQATMIQTPVNWRSARPPSHGLVWPISEVNGKEAGIEYSGTKDGFRSTIIAFSKPNIMIILLSNNNTSYYEPVVKRLVNLKYLK